jgi:hypothetical protein
VGGGVSLCVRKRSVKENQWDLSKLFFEKENSPSRCSFLWKVMDYITAVGSRNYQIEGTD